MEVEIVTLTLSRQPVDLRYVDVKEIRDRLVERRASAQELRHVLSNALDSGRGRIDESHCLEFVSVIAAIKKERPGFYTPALRRLAQVAQER
jgi:hypothetical protein